MTTKVALPADRRAAVRYPGYFNAAIVFDDGRIQECGVLDYSTLGALLIVEDAATISDAFVLEAQNGYRREVMVVRRERNKIAVRFA